MLIHLFTKRVLSHIISITVRSFHTCTFIHLPGGQALKGPGLAGGRSNIFRAPSFTLPGLPALGHGSICLLSLPGTTAEETLESNGLSLRGGPAKPTEAFAAVQDAGLYHHTQSHHPRLFLINSLSSSPSSILVLSIISAFPQLRGAGGGASLGFYFCIDLQLLGEINIKLSLVLPNSTILPLSSAI